MSSRDKQIQVNVKVAKLDMLVNLVLNVLVWVVHTQIKLMLLIVKNVLLDTIALILLILLLPFTINAQQVLIVVRVGQIAILVQLDKYVLIME